MTKLQIVNDLEWYREERTRLIKELNVVTLERDELRRKETYRKVKDNIIKHLKDNCVDNRLTDIRYH